MEATSQHGSADRDKVNIQFLYFSSCPNAETALDRLHSTLQSANVLAEIEMILVETDEAAAAHNFFGSPTIRINGVDVVPPAGHAQPSLACRMYLHPDGHLAPYPSAEELIQAINKARLSELQ